MGKKQDDRTTGPRAIKRRLWLVLAAATLSAVALHVAYGTAYYVSNLEAEAKRAFSDGFENGDLSAWHDGEIELCCEHSATIVAQGAREGARALKISLRAEDPHVAGSKRAELRLKAVALGEERWYAFSLFVPQEWPGTEDIVTVAQWHAVDDKILGEGGRPPPLRLILKGETWNIASHWDSHRLTGMPFMNASPREGAALWSGPLERGVWTDWIFRVRWSHAEDGMIEAWKDGASIIRRDGPNAYNDWMGPFFKVGIYIPQWKTPGVAPKDARRELLVDQVKQDIEPIMPAGNDTALSDVSSEND